MPTENFQVGKPNAGAALEPVWNAVMLHIIQLSKPK